MAKLGLELYTVREEAERDLLGALRRVAAMGYEGVEFAAFYGVGAADLRRTLNELPLDVAGACVQMEELTGRLEEVIAYNRAIGSPMIVCPWLAERYRESADAWKRTAETLNGIGARCRKAGLLFLYHIHGYEFSDCGGKTGLDWLIERTDPALVGFEPDTYWIEHAGVNPVALMRYLGAHCPYIHLKDMRDRETRRDVEVGAGCIDMAGVLCEAEKYGAAWYLVEQEQFDMPPMESAAISLCNLRRICAQNR